MSNTACSLSLYIKDKNGEDVKSKLYDDLVKSTEVRGTANKIYNAITSDNFKNSPMYQTLDFDENGEPTFESLYNNGLKEILTNETIICDRYAKELGGVDKYGMKKEIDGGVTENNIELFRKIDEFNNDPTKKGFLAMLKSSATSEGGVIYEVDVEIVDEKDTVYELYRKKFSQFLSVIDKLVKGNIDKATGSSFNKLTDNMYCKLLESITSKMISAYDLKFFMDIEDFDPTKVAKLFYASINMLNGNNNEYMKGQFNINELGEEDRRQIINIISESIYEYEKNDSYNVLKRLENALNEPENSSLIGGDGIISEDEKKFSDWSKIAITRLIYDRLNGKKTNIEAIDNLVSITLNNAHNAIYINSGQLENMAKDVFDNIKMIEEYDVETKEETKEEKTIYEENSNFIKKEVNEASDKIKELERYDSVLNELFQTIINSEYRRRSMLREKSGLSDIQNELINKDLNRIDDIISKLSNARKIEQISTAIYKYIEDIGERVQMYDELIKKMNAGNYNVKQKASILRDLNEFINIYDKISKGVRTLMLDGGSFIEDIKSSALDKLQDMITYSGVAYADVYPKELSDFADKFSSFTDDEKMNHLEELKEMGHKFNEWQAKTIGEDGRSDEDISADIDELNAEFDATLSILESARTGNLREKQINTARILSKYDEIVKNLESDFKIASRPMVAKFLESYMQDEQKIVKFGEYMGFKAGEKIDIEKLLERVEKDINMYQRIFASLNDCPDMILNLMGESIKQAKFTAQAKTQEDVEEIKREALLLEKAGIKDTGWLFEKDENGNLTGLYVHSSIEDSAFDSLCNNSEVRERFGLMEGETLHPYSSKYTEEDRQWFNRKLETFIANKKKYGAKETSKQYLEIMANPAKKRFYEFFMKKYSIMQSYYPSRATIRNRIIGLKMNEKESLSHEKGLVNKAKAQFELFKDNFRTTYNDDLATMRVDPAGHEIKMLPIYYCNFKKEDLPTVTRDCVSALMAYSLKANEYNELNEVVDSLELAKEILKNRQIERSKGGLHVIESLKRIASLRKKTEGLRSQLKEARDKGDIKKIEALEKQLKDFEDREKNERLTETDDGKSNASAMLDDIFDMQLYGRTHNLEGVVDIFGTKVDLGKVADWINKRTAEGALSLSLTNGLSNLNTGTVMMLIETLSKEYFTASDWAWAEKEYWLGANVLKTIAQQGGEARVKTSKMLLMSELFDVQNEFANYAGEAEWAMGTFKRMYGDICGFMQNAGEHYMAHRTFLAYMHNYKVKTKDGKIISLYDAFDVKYIDKDGNLVDTDQGLGAKMVMQEGIMKIDKEGNETGEFTKQDIYRVHAAVNGINHGMHGIYNQQDANAIQRYAIGRLAYMFRKWIPAAIHKRFSGIQYDMDKGKWTEGYYTTCGRIILQLYKEVLRGNKKFAELKDALSPEEIANIKRGIAEMSAFCILWFCANVLFGKGENDDDDEWKKTWIYKMLKLQVWRLYSEVAALTPTPAMAGEALRIFKSPMAGLRTAETVLGTLELLEPWRWGLFTGEMFDDTFLDDERYIVKRGIYKDHSEGFKDFMSNRVLFPKYNVVVRNIFNLEETTSMFMNQ